jgi:hypothetical protein
MGRRGKVFPLSRQPASKQVSYFLGVRVIAAGSFLPNKGGRLRRWLPLASKVEALRSPLTGAPHRG